MSVYRYECSVCGATEEGFESVDELDEAALEHMFQHHCWIISEVLDY